MSIAIGCTVLKHVKHSCKWGTMGCIELHGLKPCSVCKRLWDGAVPMGDPLFDEPSEWLTVLDDALHEVHRQQRDEEDCSEYVDEDWCKVLDPMLDNIHDSSTPEFRKQMLEIASTCLRAVRAFDKKHEKPEEGLDESSDDIWKGID